MKNLIIKKEKGEKMFSKNILSIISSLLFCAALFLPSCAFLPEGELKVDPETLKPQNRKSGLPLDEIDDLNATESNQNNLRLADSLRKANKLSNNDDNVDFDLSELSELSSLTDPFAVKKTISDDDLIDEKGWMVGHFINMSNYQVVLKIYRIRNGGLKPVYKKGFVPMWEASYSLPKGSYAATIEVNGKTQPPQCFEVRPDVRSDFDVNIYYKKSKEETTVALNGYWFIFHKQKGKERLIVNK